MSTYTTNYNLEKPEDGDTNWGEAYRDSLDTIDIQMKANETTVSDHLADAIDAHDASAISATPGTFFTQTSVQEQLTAIDTEFGAVAGGNVVTIQGEQTVTGQKTFSQPILGNLVGGVNGNVFGNVTGDIQGDVVGNLFGSVTGNVTGDVTGNVTGNVTGDVTGDLTGNADTATTAVTATNNVLKAGDTMTGELVMDGAGIQLDNNLANPAHSEGRVFYDKEEHTLAYYNDESHVTVNVGQETLLRVYNNTGSTILDGKVCYISGSNGQRATVALARANMPTTSETVIGVATHDIEDSTYGYICTSGLIHGQNTLAYPAGTRLFVSTSVSGEVQTTPPSEPYYNIEVGVVTKSDALDGHILVAIINRAAVSKADKPNGIQDKSTITVNYRADTRICSITHGVSGSIVWVGGKRYDKSGTETLTAHGTTTKKYYIYYNETGTLVHSENAWDIDLHAPVVIIYYKHDAVLPKALIFEDRHPAQGGMDNATHRYLHETMGSILHGGGVIGNYLPIQNTANLPYSISSSELDDEDLHHDIAQLNDGGPYLHLYVDGAGGTSWNWAESSVDGIIRSAGATGDIQYNNVSTGTLVSAGSNNRWINYWPIALPFYASVVGDTQTSRAPGYAVIVGQNLYTTLAQAQAASPAVLNYISNLTDEGVVFAKITYRRMSSTTAQIDENPTYYRGNILTTTSGTFSPSDHQGLSNRSATNAHPASSVSADITNFAGKLSASDTTVQAALDTLDDHAHTAAQTTVSTTNFVRNLSAADTDVQKALDTLDGLISGAGGINYIDNYDFEATADEATPAGWSMYDDGATVPVDGTGGSATTTFTAETTAPLRGSVSAIMESLTVNEGASYDFTIDSADLAKILTVSFDYEIGGSGYTDDDLSVFIIADPAGTPSVIYCTPQGVQNATGTNHFSAEFQTDSTITSYRLCLHVTATAASASVKFDNVKVGPSAKVFGAPVTDWEPVTMTHNYTGGTGVTLEAYEKRVGDTAFYRGKLYWSTPITGGGSVITLPSGRSIDTNKLDTTEQHNVGTVLVFDSGANYYSGFVKTTSTTTVTLISYTDDVGASSNHIGYANVTATVPVAVLANDDYITFEFSAPISGWSSSLQMSDDADTRVVAMRATLTADQAITAAGGDETIVFNSATIDTHAGFNASTGKYTVPVSGIYRVDYSSRFTAGATAPSQVYYAVWRNGGTPYHAPWSISDMTASKHYTATGTALVSCVAGDTLEIVANTVSQNATVEGGTTGESEFKVERLSGPSQIAASEKVVAIYTTPATTSLTSASWYALDYGTKVVDTHGAVLGVGSGHVAIASYDSGFRFVAPRSGIYTISFSNYQTTPSGYNGTGETITAAVYINGSVSFFLSELVMASATSNAFLFGSGSVWLSAGQVVSMAYRQSSGGNLALNNNAQSRISIVSE